MRREYTAEARAEAVALAASIGPRRAARQLGIPPRTVANWMHHPANSAVLAAAELSIAERLRTAHSEALSSVMDGLRDTDARLGDKATALRVLGDQLALAEGRATQNIDMHSTVTGYRTDERYTALPSEAQEQIDGLLLALLEEILTAQKALKLAGVNPEAVRVDGLQVRAELSDSDMALVSAFIHSIEDRRTPGKYLPKGTP